MQRFSDRLHNPMSTTSTTAQHPRARSQKMIEDMLQQRTRMLVLLWELSKSNLEKLDQVTREMLDEFLETLVDYIAAGHFGLYQRIAEGNERRQAVVEAAKETYPRIC